MDPKSVELGEIMQMLACEILIRHATYGLKEELKEVEQTGKNY